MEKINISILSFPSSGKHWTLHILDKTFSLGLTIISEENRKRTTSISDKMRISHSHLCWECDVKPLEETFGNIFLLRSYKENVTKFAEKHDLSNIESFKKYIDLGEPLNNSVPNQSYMRLVSEFDKMDKPKLLVYYEDLIQDPKKEIVRISEWLKEFFSFEYDPSDIDKFIFDIDVQKEEGKKFHFSSVRNINDLKSNGKIHFHSDKVSVEMKKSIDGYIKSEYPELFEKYLKRYEE